ncbi:hypothetical protein E2562_015782 [Oryza meyeriana var. granulata]|uniref:non-reducing end alpha-L-arabinofuranosidase n=1 Tax=Oryza meyeriana var. granulata TaxID=110450 RepID=A0A6G1D4D3_9ORYZ|nr:hypothetical protein E2562_015782 [Oryza meyeriana var. granulata]
MFGITGQMMALDIMSFSRTLNSTSKLSEDLGAAPIWVFNNGISHNDEVDTAAIAPFVKDVLDSLEFARGSADSTWGSVRAAMGHPEPFPVKYVAIGNEDCGKKFYRGNYLKFYNAIREAYPDIQMISNCDASSRPLDHPADLYDFHVYTDSKTLFSMKNTFDRSSRNGPKAFVSEYAVWRSDAGRGSLLASLAEAAFLTGLEKNSDVVQMASYAPLFVNNNDQTWNPDAIVFNSWQQYGTPSYWMQTLFRESSGAMIHPITITSSYSGSLAASAITWQDSENSYLRVKIINFGSDSVSLTISATGLQARVNTVGSTATVLTSSNVMDENSFSNPNKEINHAGAGGIWAELVSNRGFEAGGPHTPSNIDPWSIIGDESSIYITTDRSSCFSQNSVALRMEILCENCPAGGVGIYNPGFWGMNIEEGKAYNLVMYIRSSESVELTVSLTCSDGLQNLASVSIQDIDLSNWTKIEMKLFAQGTCRTSRLELTSTKRGVIWFDQVSLMPADTYKGHGFRKELIYMLLELRPQFLRFPGGCFVEGNWLRNAFRWRETIGPWEQRPGHFGDVWNYWTDDGLGYYEFLQLAEDLGAVPIWVFNAGVSHHDEVDTTVIEPFVKDVLDSLEFARGSEESTWGSARAAMGHPEPFPVKYVAIGNEDCEKEFYRGNYLKFYNTICKAYPDIQMISNCDGSSRALDHPADLYDFHVYTSAANLFLMKNKFDRTSRIGPKVFVSEYAVNEQKDTGKGSLLASLAEAAFLTGLEKNSDVVQMASYAPLFVNDNDRTWNPDAIVFNSWQQYGTPSYWMQTYFRESSGSVIHPITISSSYSDSLAASAITWKDTEGIFLRVKIVNFGPNAVNLTISSKGLQAGVNAEKSTATILTSGNLLDENSFSEPNKIVPVTSELPDASAEMEALLLPYSFTSFDLALDQYIKLVAEM